MISALEARIADVIHREGQARRALHLLIHSKIITDCADMT